SKRPRKRRRRLSDFSKRSRKRLRWLSALSKRRRKLLRWLSDHSKLVYGPLGGPRTSKAISTPIRVALSPCADGNARDGFCRCAPSWDHPVFRVMGPGEVGATGAQHEPS